MDDTGYIELNVIIPSADNEKREIVIALLSGHGFESFVETPSGINAYITTREFNTKAVAESGISGLELLNGIEFSHRVIEKINWNRQWESSFPQLMIAGRCSVRASFHPEPKNAEFDIIIDPEMSFGTGHNHTTALMVELLLDLPVTGRTLLDIGCGTGILSILAAKKGAAGVNAVDIDEWAWKNAIDNGILNNVQLTVRHGDIAIIKGEKYDIVVANIMRNTLLENMQVLCSAMNNKGSLLLSGFFTADLGDIAEAAHREGLKHVRFIEREGWCAAEFF